MASAAQHPRKVQIDLTVFFIQKIIEPYFFFFFLQLGFKWNICHVTLLELKLNTQRLYSQ